MLTNRLSVFFTLEMGDEIVTCFVNNIAYFANAGGSSMAAHGDALAVNKVSQTNSLTNTFSP